MLSSKKWYGLIPHCRSPQFPGFIVASRELVIFITDNDKIVLRLVPGEETASAAIDKGEIRISPLVFSPDFYGEVVVPKSQYSASMVSVANGWVVHEAAHFLKSDSLISKTIDRMPFESTEEKAAAKGDYSLAVVVNLGEDIFIEDWLGKAHPIYNTFLIATHQLMFSDSELAKRIEKTVGVLGTVNDQIPSSEILNILLCMKNWRFIDADIWGPVIKPYVKMFRLFREMENKDDRAELAYKIWQKFKTDKEVRYEPQGIDRDLSMICIDDEDLIIVCTKEGLARLVQLLKDRDADAIARPIHEALEEESVRIRKEEDELELSQIPPIRVEEVSPASTITIFPDKRFIGLGRALRLAFTHNIAPGPPLKRGTVLVNTRLARIITDEKIFTHREKRPATGRQYELGILCDCSGSMRGDKVKEALEVGLAAHFSLRQAKVRSFLMGHTSRSGGAENEWPVLYIIARPDDNLRIVSQRMSAFYKTGRSILNNNYDGFAISEAAKVGFTKRATRKWLFVISDGEPSGSHYGGDEAMYHTRSCVNEVRQKKIDVVSITIEEGTYKKNDTIYGPGKNIKTSSPAVIKDLIMAMFLTKGGLDG